MGMETECLTWFQSVYIHLKLEIYRGRRHGEDFIADFTDGTGRNSKYFCLRMFIQIWCIITANIPLLAHPILSRRIKPQSQSQ